MLNLQRDAIFTPNKLYSGAGTNTSYRTRHLLLITKAKGAACLALAGRVLGALEAASDHQSEFIGLQPAVAERSLPETLTGD